MQAGGFIVKKVRLGCTAGTIGAEKAVSPAAGTFIT